MTFSPPPFPAARHTADPRELLFPYSPLQSPTMASSPRVGPSTPSFRFFSWKHHSNTVHRTPDMELLQPHPPYTSTRRLKTRDPPTNKYGSSPEKSVRNHGRSLTRPTSCLEEASTVPSSSFSPFPFSTPSGVSPACGTCSADFFERTSFASKQDRPSFSP